MTLLEFILSSSSASLVGEYATLNQLSKITFICKCGTECTKKFHSLIHSSHMSASCKICTKQTRLERHKATMMKRYGAEHTMHVEAFRKKQEETVIKRYGVTNPLKNKDILAKVEATNLKRYGATSPFLNKDIQEKIKATNLQKYGSENPFQSDQIKEQIKKTNLNIYGVEHPTQNDQVQKKLEATSMKKYGCKRPSENKEIKKKIQKAHKEKTPEERHAINQKVIETSLKHYGKPSPNQADEVKEAKKQTCIEKYGVENPNQSIIIQEKNQNKGFKRKQYTMPSGDIRILQGYEPLAMDELLTLYSEDQIETCHSKIPRISYSSDSKTRYYFPDIYIPSENKIIEVKSTWTYKCVKDNVHIKASATKEAGYMYEIWIYNAKKEKTVIIP